MKNRNISNKMENKVEIMAPAGSYESLQAAIKAGADSVYFGVGKLNMRARAANNFLLKDLKKIVKLCEEKGIKTYLTLNTIMYDEDLGNMKKICDKAKEAGISAIIASDISTIAYANSIGLEVHISTQANVSNFEAVKFYSNYADVIVLARELTLKQIKSIINKIKKENLLGPSGKPLRIELFVHGAMCVAIAGKCHMSLSLYNHSANRGDCLQACRRSYLVRDEETGDELKIENKYVMSPKDLCTLRFLDKILKAGISVLKIEGRGRSPEYVYTVVKTYKEAVELIKKGRYTQEKIRELENEVSKAFNRGFWHGGYYLGKKLGEWAGTYGSKATEKKSYVGKIKNYFQKNKIVHAVIETGSIKKGDRILIIGPTTGVVKSMISSIKINDKHAEKAKKGDEVTFPILEKVRKNDKLYILKPRKITD